MGKSVSKLTYVVGLVGFLGLAGLWGCDSDNEPGGAGGDAATVDGAGGGGGSDCEVDTRQCSAEGVPQLCRDPGGWTDLDPCPEGDVCRDGECRLPIVCEPNASRCGAPTVLELCNAEGTAWEPTNCERECREAGGTATCNDEVCTPGMRSCQGDQVVVECNAEGTGYEFLERCNGARTGRECSSGECIPLCVLNEKTKTNVGCDYWAADLDNAFVPGGETGFIDAAAQQFAVVVSNPHPDFTGEVSVYNHEELVQSAIVPPLGLHVFQLPRRDVDGTVKAPRAYRVRSSIPIVAYQFNPLDNVEVFSNDASLLLPSHVLGKDYFIMTREQSFDRLRGYLTVIGIEHGDPPTTTVTVQVTARTQAGVGGLPAMEPGDEVTVELAPFEALSIQTAAPGADLTGSKVTANQNVVVFGGSEAANVPNTNHCIDIDPVTREGVCEYKVDEPCRDNYDCNSARLNTCCADHLEQQLFPISTWRQHYIATKSYDRGDERDYWRIMASQDDTKVETVPPQAVIPTLNAGEWFEFGSREHFEIISDKPIMVGQFLASEQAPDPNLRNIIEPGDAGTGDPAFILAVPTEHFREQFVFLAPDQYAFDYVSVIAPIGAQVFFDDRPIDSGWEPVGLGEEYQVARFDIGDGVHFIDADAPVAVIVYGYDQYVSYGYPGGLRLDVDEETGEGVEGAGGAGGAGGEGGAGGAGGAGGEGGVGGEGGMGGDAAGGAGDGGEGGAE